MNTKPRRCPACRRTLPWQRFYYNWKIRRVCLACSGHLGRATDKRKESGS